MSCQVEVQQKIIADLEAGKVAWDARQAELSKEVPDFIESFFNLISQVEKRGEENSRLQEGKKRWGNKNLII